MSRTVNSRDTPREEGIETGGTRISYPPNQSQAPSGEASFTDGSDPLFSMYLERAEDQDKKMAARWKADADGILVFTGLFSAAVATFLGISVQDLKPNSQDTSAFYLANIYQLLAANANGSIVSVLPTLSAPPPFSPARSTVWVNSLWFLSLAMSLTCALLATLLQQWARRYLWVTHPRCSPHRRARIRSFFAEGVEKLHLPWVVEALPALLHTSLLLFFSGLVVFLSNIHHTVFIVISCWVGVGLGVYMCITFVPIVRQDSPYYTPLSLYVWFLVTGVLYVFFEFLYVLDVFHLYSYDTWRRLVFFKERYLWRLLNGLVKAAEETASGLGSAIDGRALLWMLESLDEDHELERFFAAIPGFCNSQVVIDPLGCFIKPNDKKLSVALIEFMERTLSSNLISEPIKQRRIVVCRMAVDATSLSASRQILDRVLFGTWIDQLYSIDFGLSARRWAHDANPYTKIRANCVVALVLAYVQERDERWRSLAVDQLGVSTPVLRRCLSHGDSVLLANLIFLAREIFLFHLNNGDWPFFYGVSIRILEAISKFETEGTLPELQNQFCDLWNRLVLEGGKNNRRHIRLTTARMLRRIRKVYIALHVDATPATLPIPTNEDDPILNWASSYPLCHTHSDVSTLTPLDPGSRSLMTAAREDLADSPMTSSALLTLAPSSAL